MPDETIDDEFMPMIQSLAHEGSEDSLKKLEELLLSETDEDKKAYLELALDESRMFYYDSSSEEDEKDLALAGLILEKENQIFDVAERIEAAEERELKWRLDGAVHEKVLAANSGKADEWQYQFIGDLGCRQGMSSEELKSEQAYLEAWIDEAKEMITDKKYLSVPVGFWATRHCPCDDEDDGVCPSCGREMDNEDNVDPW